MRLSCKRVKNIIIGAFHSAKDEPNIVTEFIDTLKDEFFSSFSDLHTSLRQQLDSIVDEKVESMVSDFILRAKIYKNCK
jgi:predicted RecB family endonuclease